MAASVETKGKSVDEAIFNGLNELGLGIDEVDIEILEEGGRGFLGLGRSAKVRLTERTAPPPEPEPEEPERVEEHAPRQEHRERRDGPRRERGRKRPGPRQENRRQREPAADKTPEPEEAVPEVRVLETVDIPAAQRAVDFLTGLFEAMKVRAKVDVLEGTQPDSLKLRITGEDTSVLIGRRGDTLDTLQYLTGLVVNKNSDDYIRIMLDAEDYRHKREQTLERLAVRLASNVVRTGRPARLEPMNPYERRIMHAALQSNPQVETHSEGVDPNRRVVIRKKKITSRERFDDL